MSLSYSICKLKGKVQHYTWGGVEFLPDLLELANLDKRPFAEYWMGAHVSAPSDLQTPDGPVSLQQVINNDPVQALSEKVYRQFGELPYLFKVLDVKDMLSIQVHPTKAAAEIGFDLEEAAGIPLQAVNRNYKDRNHKPEVMVALSEFWLLHGFKSRAALEKSLDEVPEFTVLLPLFRRDGYQALYQFVMEMEQPDVNALLGQTVKREMRRKHDGELDPSQPGWWVAGLYENNPEIGDIDRGVFSLYFFNIVHLQRGEAIFQGAGIPHAYLRGQNIELMANSDNVLRGGLTPKHIDVPELMKHVLFEEVAPVILKGHELLPGETVYPCPVADFGISRIELSNSLDCHSIAGSLEIIIATEGGAVLNNSMIIKKGEAVAVFPGNEYTIQASGHCTLFKAFVPMA